MKRTVFALSICLWWACAAARAQEVPSGGDAAAQRDPVADVVAQIEQAQRDAKAVRLSLSSRGKMPGGLEVATTGELRVLRGTQPDTADKLYSRFEYTFGEGLGGRVELAQTAAGVTMFEQDPAFGAVLLHVPPIVVRDLEWAGAVLQREDLPGMADSRARSPFGSALLVELRRTFALRVEPGERDGVAGTWVRGDRKPGLDDQDPDLPLADRVEVFVGASPRAVMSARYLVGEQAVQEITVDRLEVDAKFDDASFAVDGRDLRQRDVQVYQPMWEQIQQTLERAEAKAKDGQVRPSKR